MTRGAGNQIVRRRAVLSPGYGRLRSIHAFIRVLILGALIALPATATMANSGVPIEGKANSSEALGAAPAVIRIGPDANALATISVGREGGAAVSDPASITIGPAHPMMASISVGDAAGFNFGSAVTVSRAADGAGLPAYIVPLISSSSRPNGLPVSSPVLTSSYGFREHPVLRGRRFHSGVDLAAPVGSPIAATSDGVVSTAGWHGGYGLLVVLDNGKGLQTRYGHMSRVNVMAGQRVKRGQVIGFVGSTGRSTGPHVHYEMRVNGRAVDPLGGNSR